MPITLITGPANSGKAHLVMSAVRAHLAHGEEPLLIVPTAVDADHYRRELAGEGAVMGVRVERFDGLIGEAVHRAGVAEPLLGGLSRERVLVAILDRHGIPAAPGFVRALGDFIGELRVCRVGPARLGGALRQWAAVDGAEHPRDELGELFAEYQQALERIGRADEEQRAMRALDALRRRPALWRGTPVLFYGFDDLTRLQIDAIETLGAVAGAQVTVSLAFQPGRSAFAGRAATFQALAPLAAAHTALQAREDYYAPHAGAALGHLERSLFEPGARRADPGGAVRLLEGTDQRAELELVAEEIATLLGGGMAADQIAVVQRGSSAAADLLEEVLGEACIPFALQRRRRFADTAVGRALIGLLRCVADGDGVARGETGDLLAWLRAPGLLERPELADRLEVRARRTGAHGATRARALWEEHNWRLDTIEELRLGGGALIDRAMRELEWLFCAPRRARASVLSGGELDEARALEAGRRALGELRDLARLSAELAPADAEELARVLEGVEFVSGERPAPGTVAVADPLSLRARRVRALFVCGCTDGVFPAPARAQPVLAEEERRRLAEVSGLTDLRSATYEDALAAERYLLYAAVSRPEELLVLSWHATSDEGVPVGASPFVDDVCDLFDERLTERPESRRAPIKRGRAHASATGGGLGPLREAELLENRRETGGGADGHVWSASSLELWIRCPMRWFVERVLRARDLDPEPEPFARGGLAHAALKDTLEGLRASTGSARLTPGSLEMARGLLREALRDNEPEFPLSVAPERRPGMRRRLQADLERYLEHAAAATVEERAGGDGDGPSGEPLEPRHLELEFGFSEGGDGLPAFDLGGGVMLRGRIDRVDVSDAGEAVVYDYKGSSVPAAAKWISEGNVQVALYMRVVEDLLGLRVVGGLYQPLTGSDLRPRGVLDGDSAVAVECVGADRQPPAEMRTLLAQATALAREAAAQAGRGEIEARPRSCAFRGGCSHPTICRCER